MIFTSCVVHDFCFNDDEKRNVFCFFAKNEAIIDENVCFDFDDEYFFFHFDDDDDNFSRKKIKCYFVRCSFDHCVDIVIQTKLQC